MNKDFLEKENCHPIHLTVEESVNYANETLEHPVEYIDMNTILKFFIPSCGKRRKVGQRGRPSILYNDASVREIVEVIRTHRGKL